MRNSILLHDVSPDELTSQFQKLQDQIADIKQNFQPKVPTEYISRSLVAKMLDCDLSTVHNWTKKGHLQAYGIGGRVYYKKNEIEAKMIPLNPNV